MRMKAERFDCMISTGGIGGGSFFLLDGNHTIGREESRSGKFLKQTDACKGHIISHYVQVMMGSDFPVKFVGAVGNDALGKDLIEAMRQAGLCTEFLSVRDGLSTLYAFCFLYPDGSGGNLTVNDSASSAVTPEQLEGLEAALFTSSRPVVVAAPEVPLETRIRLLELGRKHNAFNSASFLSGEMVEVKRNDYLQRVDLLAINLDEAALLAGVSAEETGPEKIAAILTEQHPALQLSITAGKNGSFSYDGNSLQKHEIAQVTTVNTAGAGDAHFAGVLVGLACGLDLHAAHEVGALIGGMAVMSPDTLNLSATPKALGEFAKRQKLSKEIMEKLS